MVGRPEAEVPARRIASLSALANLCAQASVADVAHAPAIMAKAAEFRDQLHVAYEAAELMLLEVHQALGSKEEPQQEKAQVRVARARELKKRV
jgi:hypothetical protein